MFSSLDRFFSLLESSDFDFFCYKKKRPGQRSNKNKIKQDIDPLIINHFKVGHFLYIQTHDLSDRLSDLIFNFMQCVVMSHNLRQSVAYSICPYAERRNHLLLFSTQRRLSRKSSSKWTFSTEFSLMLSHENVQTVQSSYWIQQS